MDEVVEIVVLVLAVAIGAGLARRLGLAAPILLVGAGVVMSFVPGVPEYRLDPEVVLVAFLPPLLYGAAFNASLPAFKANLRPIGLLSVGLVLFTTLVVGIVAAVVVPGLSLAAGFTLGAIVAPPDAVAATAIARRVGLPRRIVTVLEGESLVNDATALTSYRVAQAVAIGGGFSVLEAGWEFLVAAGGGLLVGAAAAWLFEQAHRRIQDPVFDITLSLLAPFVAFVAAEEIHASGVLAVVVSGLWIGHRAYDFLSAESRLEGRAVWRTLGFLLEGIVFALIGLQLRDVFDALSGESVATLTVAAVAVLVAVLVTRFVWVFPATYLARLVPAVRNRDPSPPWQVPFVISWAGMRGVVSLAAALALPLDFPQRDVMLFLTVVVILGTLVLQGLTLPAVIRWLGLQPPDAQRDAVQEAQAQHLASVAALERLDAIVATDGELPPGVEDTLRAQVEARRNAAWEQLGDQSRETPSRAYRRIRLDMLAAEREVLVRLRDEGRLEDQVMERVQRTLDLEEARLGPEWSDD